MKKKTYYIVEDDGYGQRGTDIEEVKLTKKEYEQITRQDRRERNYSIFEKYSSALYYTQD
jgi:hypothetical protein